MIYTTGTKEIQFKNTAVALGKFEGLHRGHQLLFDHLSSFRLQGLKTVMFTFDFHPSSVLNQKEKQLLYTAKERRYIAQDMGLDVLVEYPFTEETAHMAPEAFVREVLIQKMDVKAIVVGEDFRFGYKRQGDVQLLEDMAQEGGYQVVICRKLSIEVPQFDGLESWNKVRLNKRPDKMVSKEVSSTLVRAYLEKGNMACVNQLLGRPFAIIGEVVHGREIGRTIGMPTANIAPSAGKLLPPNGVYSTITIVDGVGHHSVTNIGLNPTIAEGNPKRVETYVYDFSGDIYGKEIEVRFFWYERPEMKFACLEALKAQISKDKFNTIEFFRGRDELD